MSKQSVEIVPPTQEVRRATVIVEMSMSRGGFVADPPTG
jgi:hypothetical protein